MSWVGSLFFMGALLGSLIGGWLMDTFGRKNSQIILNIPLAIGWILLIAAVHPSNLKKKKNSSVNLHLYSFTH